MNKPTIVIAIGYIIGILWGIYVKNIVLFFSVQILFVLIWIILYNSRKRKICRFIISKIKLGIVSTFIISLIAGFAQTSNMDKKYEKLYKQENYTLKVISNKKEEKYYDKYLTKIQGYNINVYVLVSKKELLNYGDYIKVEAKIEKAEIARNEYQFNYRQYLKSINTAGTIKLDKNYKIIKNNKKEINTQIYIVKESIRLHIYSLIKTDSKYVVEALLLGNKDKLSNQIQENFRNSGLAHLLAISGTHIAIISVVLNKILKFLRCGKRVTQIISALILFIYIFIAGSTPSVIRAVVSLILLIISKAIYRKFDIGVGLAISTLIILIPNPYAILNLSFVLSYLGVIGVLFYLIIKEKYKVKNPIISTVCASMCIQIVLIPVLINNFNCIALVGIVSNLCTSLILETIIGISVIAIMISYLCMPISLILGIAIDFLINILLKICEISANLPFSNLMCTRLSLATIIVYYAILLYTIYLVKIGRLHVLKHFINKHLIKIISISLILAVILNLYNISGIKNLEIFFIDVGQGDATLIKTPHNKSILIDGGGTISDNYDTIGKNILLPFLLNHSIKTIDVLIISHLDTDHCGAAMYVMQKIKVKNVIISKQYEKSENYDNFIKIVKDRNIKVSIVEARQVINIEDELHFNILWPDTKNIVNDNVLNNNSIVCKLVYKDFSMLFTGDIEKLAEESILKEYTNNLKLLKSDILKVAHHGSNTSSTIKFLEKVAPIVALIGVGENNKFGHPSETTLENLRKIKCKIYRTDKNGQIIIKINKKGKIKASKILD